MALAGFFGGAGGGSIDDSEMGCGGCGRGGWGRGRGKGMAARERERRGGRERVSSSARPGAPQGPPRACDRGARRWQRPTSIAPLAPERGCVSAQASNPESEREEDERAQQLLLLLFRSSPSLLRTRRSAASRRVGRHGRAGGWSVGVTGRQTRTFLADNVLPAPRANAANGLLAPPPPGRRENDSTVAMVRCSLSSHAQGEA
jgi:hypothetical protein